MNETFMKEKPIFPLLLGMGMPMVLSMLVNSLYNIVDSYFVARISENAMEALSLVFPIQNFINAMAIGFGVGINALIATARGAGKENEAGVKCYHRQRYIQRHAFQPEVPQNAIALFQMAACSALTIVPAGDV